MTYKGTVHKVFENYVTRGRGAVEEYKCYLCKRFIVLFGSDSSFQSEELYDIRRSIFFDIADNSALVANPNQNIISLLINKENNNTVMMYHIRIKTN